MRQGLYSLSGKTFTAKSLEVSMPRDCVYNDRIVLQFDRHLVSGVTEVPVKFQNDWNSSIANLAASRLHEIFRYDTRPFSE